MFTVVVTGNEQVRVVYIGSLAAMAVPLAAGASFVIGLIPPAAGASTKVVFVVTIQPSHVHVEHRKGWQGCSHCTLFNQHMSTWNMERVVSYMYCGKTKTAFNKDPSKWDTRKVS